MTDTRPEFDFTVQARDGKARRGVVQTAWGAVDTPVFMPVGTAASVKAMMPWQVAQTGAQIILSNTYHLMLRPGADRIERLGGVRKLMGWNGPLLTDSGGFQVMSLGPLRKIDEEGVTFKSHLDGSRYKLTPESSTQIQHKLDATITMAFDECTPYPCSKQEAEESMALSIGGGSGGGGTLGVRCDRRRRSRDERTTKPKTSRSSAIVSSLCVRDINRWRALPRARAERRPTFIPYR